jgi:hypothetical protein
MVAGSACYDAYLEREEWKMEEAWPKRRTVMDADFTTTCASGACRLAYPDEQGSSQTLPFVPT